MAGLLALFSEFERGILRERTRADLAQARENGKRLGRPETRRGMPLQIVRTSVHRILARLYSRHR